MWTGVLNSLWVVSSKRSPESPVDFRFGASTSTTVYIRSIYGQISSCYSVSWWETLLLRTSAGHARSMASRHRGVFQVEKSLSIFNEAENCYSSPRWVGQQSGFFFCFLQLDYLSDYEALCQMNNLYGSKVSLQIYTEERSQYYLRSTFSTPRSPIIGQAS